MFVVVVLGINEELGEFEKVEIVEYAVDVDLIEFGVYELSWLLKLELLSLDDVTNESGDRAVCRRCSN